MPHMLLIHEPIGQRATRSDAEGRAVYERMLRWGEDLKERGLLLAAESLASTDSAVRVTVPAGKFTAVAVRRTTPGTADHTTFWLAPGVGVVRLSGKTELAGEPGAPPVVFEWKLKGYTPGKDK